MLETYHVFIDKRGRPFVQPVRLSRWGRWCRQFEEGTGPIFWGAVIVTAVCLHLLLYAVLILGISL